MKRQPLPAQVIVIAAPLLLCSLLIGVGSALAFRPAALSSSTVDTSAFTKLQPSATPSASPSSAASPSGRSMPESSPRASNGAAGGQLPP